MKFKTNVFFFFCLVINNGNVKRDVLREKFVSFFVIFLARYKIDAIKVMFLAVLKMGPN